MISKNLTPAGNTPTKPTIVVLKKKLLSAAGGSGSIAAQVIIPEVISSVQ